MESELLLQRWTKKRRVVILRRPSVDGTPVGTATDNGQPVLTGTVVIPKDRPVYECAVLVTSLAEDEVFTIAQLYRDRADAENVFDELENQWEWARLTTKDLRRSQLMARSVALVFNWSSLYVRLAMPKRHTEAVTSRPALVYGIAIQTRHGTQTKVKITSCDGGLELSGRYWGQQVDSCPGLPPLRSREHGTKVGYFAAGALSRILSLR